MSDTHTGGVSTLEMTRDEKISAALKKAALSIANELVQSG